MKTEAERLKAVHEKAEGIRHQMQKRAIAVLSVVSFCVLAGIVSILNRFGGLHESLQNGGFTGSSLLDSGAGGYVLVGVVSFAIAVVVTVLCIRYRRR